ncbi:MAG: hypothetical protein GY861_01805 [bacterium]|nr:hypothetical protein [bacterium]
MAKQKSIISPLYTTNQDITNTWKYLRGIIFNYVLRHQTTTLEAMPLLKLSFYDIKPTVSILARETTNELLRKFLTKGIKNLCPTMLIYESEHRYKHIKIITRLADGDTSLHHDITIQLELSATKRVTKYDNHNDIISLHKNLKMPYILYIFSNAPLHKIEQHIIKINNAESNIAKNKENENLTKSLNNTSS